ncbi:Uncharacterized protein Rs2_40864 [Raphanus sativus]|nr:Uncharacterized protein Rs2_40864 [Raphanus sativus]
MEEGTNVMEQLAIMMAKIENMGSELKSDLRSLTERVNALESQPSSPKAQDIKKKGVLQDRSSAIKFSTEELSEVENFSRSKGGKALPLQAGEAGTSLGGYQRPGNFSGPWQARAVGRERGNRRADGGGDWNVRPIGAAPLDYLPNPGDFRNSEGLPEREYYEAREDRNNNFERRCVKAAKIEFPPFDGTTNAMEWLQKCDDFFSDQRIFSDDAKVRQASFVLTGQAYHWNLNLRRLVTHKLGWEEFKRVCKSRFGKADAVNPVGELSNLRHTGTVDEYCSQFEECLSRQTRLSGRLEGIWLHYLDI